MHYNATQTQDEHQYSTEEKNELMQMMITESNLMVQQAIDQQPYKGLFTVKTGDLWLKEAKEIIVPKMLFGEFWYEGEICILFADTNVGKSILAVQIANSIAKGRAIPGFALEAEVQAVLYFDFELTTKQFENRYTANYEQPYFFGGNFSRVEINPDADTPGEMEFEDFVIMSLERCIIEGNARVLIIDNLTYLKNDTEKAKDAMPLMKQLKLLKEKYKLSMLVLGHTPKRDTTKALDRNDALGSKMLMAFCDSSFTIGESLTETGIRYLKQVKARNTAIVYHDKNVCNCAIVKPDNFLHFQFLGYGKERMHLLATNDEQREKRLTDAIALRNHGNTNVDIAKHFGVTEAAVRKWFIKANGQ